MWQQYVPSHVELLYCRLMIPVERPAGPQGGWGLQRRGRSHGGVGRYSRFAPCPHPPLHKECYETQSAWLFDSHEPVVSHFQRGWKKKKQQQSGSYVIRGRRRTSESPQQQHSGPLCGTVTTFTLCTFKHFFRFFSVI